MSLDYSKMRVLLQIGYAKASRHKRVGQLIRAYVDDEECQWSEGHGKWLTSHFESQQGCRWFLWEGDVEPAQVIRIEVSTSMVGVGKDEKKTFTSLYYLDESVPIRDIYVSGVGFGKYPLAKGRLVEVGSVSDADKRKSEIDEFLGGEF